MKKLSKQQIVVLSILVVGVVIDLISVAYGDHSGELIGAAIIFIGAIMSVDIPFPPEKKN